MAPTAIAPSVFCKLTFKDIVLVEEHSEIFSASFSQPLRVDTKDVKVAFAVRDELVVYQIAYSLQVIDGADRRIWAMDCAYHLIFAANQPVTEAEAKGDVPTLLGIAHPYLTQHVHERSMIMGLPPLLLEIYSPPDAT